MKADKDLLRLYSKISEIRANKRFDSLANAKELGELKLSIENRNAMASTYLNICAVLSQMGNHDKALHMSQKAVEMITQQDRDRYFVLENFIEKLTGDDFSNTLSSRDVLITLAASYYNKAIELEYLCNLNRGNKEYLVMAGDAIQNAQLVCSQFPDGLNLPLSDEIKRLHEKLIYRRGTVGLVSSRGSSRRSQRRIFSPPVHMILKDTNISDIQKYIDTTPKSLENGPKASYLTKNDQAISPMYRRRFNETEKKGNVTELRISFSPLRSDGANDIECESVKFSDASNPPQKQHPYFNRRNGPSRGRKIAMSKPTKMIDIKPKFATNNFPPLPLKESAKTSFECQPVVPKTNSLVMPRNILQIDRNSVPERHYQLEDPDFVQDWGIRKEYGSRWARNANNKKVS